MVRVIKGIWAFFIEAFWCQVSANRSALAGRMRSWRYRTECQIDTGVQIVNPHNFNAGIQSILNHGCIVLNTNGIFYIGNHSHLGAYCYVNLGYGKVTIGDHVAVGPGTKIIAYSNHYETGKKITECRIIGEIEIANNVFIGANCVILPDAKIGENTIIAAGSVVKGELSGNAIYAGSPCRKIREGWYTSA